MKERKRTVTGVIKDYFGQREGDSLRDFMDELLQLTKEEKLDLAKGAARELGLNREQVDFEM